MVGLKASVSSTDARLSSVESLGSAPLKAPDRDSFLCYICLVLHQHRLQMLFASARRANPDRFLSAGGSITAETNKPDIWVTVATVSQLCAAVPSLSNRLANHVTFIRDRDKAVYN